jgi:hypothetical protein
MNLNKRELSQTEYIQKLKEIKKANYEVVKFDYYNDIKNVGLNVDSDNIEGDSFADLYYNSKDKAGNNLIKININIIKIINLY